MRTQVYLGIALIVGAPIVLAISYVLGAIPNLMTTIENIIVLTVTAMIASGASLIWAGRTPAGKQTSSVKDRRTHYNLMNDLVFRRLSTIQIVMLPVTPQRSPQTVSEHFRIMVALEIDREKIAIQTLFSSAIYLPAEKHLKVDKPELLSALHSLVENAQKFNEEVSTFQNALRDQFLTACKRNMLEELASGRIETDEIMRVLGGYCAFTDALLKNGSLSVGATRQPETYELNFWRVSVSEAGYCSIGGAGVGKEFTQANGDRLGNLLQNILHTRFSFSTVERLVAQRAKLEHDSADIRRMVEEIISSILYLQYSTVIKGCCPD